MAMSPLFASRHPPRGLAWHLVLLVTVTLVPAFVFSAVVFGLLWREQREHVERGLVDTARAQAVVVQRELQSSVLALQGLGRSTLLDRGDFRSLYAESVAVMRGEPIWSTVILSDARGRPVFNLRRPYGTPLPDLHLGQAFETVIRQRTPAVTPLIRSPLTRGWVTAILVPVIRDDRVRYVLIAGIDQPVWAALIETWKVPEEWFSVLVDQEGVIVARTRSPERFVGQPATAEYRRRSRLGREGVFKQPTLEGVPVYVAYARVPVADWSVALAIPASLVESAPRRLLYTTGAAFLLVFALALALAVYLSRRLARPIGAVARSAAALGQGLPLPPRPGPSGIAEVETLTETLENAARLLRQRAIERDEALTLERRARAEAEAANRSKDDFLAVLSHELRTPLNAMLGWVRMLRSRRLPPAEEARALEVIDRNIGVQTKLIDDLLDVSRIVAGKLQLDTRPVSVGELARYVVEAFAGPASDKGIRLSLEGQAGGGVVLGDPVRIQQMIGNLVSNAVKFSPPGETVRVVVARAGERVQVVVQDTGEGIPPEALPHIFDRFRQADSSRTRRSGGLGLGLAIVSYLARVHGGRVSADSPGAGRGATFTLELPALPVAAAERAIPEPDESSGPEPSLVGLRVLLVEDDPDSREMAAGALRAGGADVVAVESAAQALVHLDERLVDVLISDLAMPDTDGFALLDGVRAMASPNGTVAAVALTAFADAETRARAHAVGFRFFAAKPITPTALRRLVARAAGRQVEA